PLPSGAAVTEYTHKEARRWASRDNPRAFRIWGIGMAISSAVIGPRPLSVTGFIRYSERAADGGWIERDGRSSFGTEDHEVEIHNARMTQTCFEKQGFTLVKQATDVDFTNLVDVEQRYYPAVCELVKKLTG